ncbi:Secernin-2 [Mactra antiquata]
MSDIFVVLPPLTPDNCVIFAKNSDRPPTEVQEVVYFPPGDHTAGSKLQCTFVEVDQVEHTYAVVLSKPAWSWGAEMGANEHGVCIGNTAVWTKLCRPGDHEEKLTGCDFVRLGLERAKTAREAVTVITDLLTSHGQGGLCSEDHNFGQWTYHSSYVMADSNEAWVVDTAGKFWTAKKVTSGMLTKSSALSIGTDAEMTLADLSTHAQSAGYWKAEDGPLDFSKAFSAEYAGISLSDKQMPSNRSKTLNDSLDKKSKEGKMTIENAFDILRDEANSINFVGELLTVGSQVSLIAPPTSGQPSCHWFTATPNTNYSVFKPFMFCENVTVGNWTVSPATSERPNPTFRTSSDRRHSLYKAHEKGRDLMETGNPIGQKLRTTMKTLEKQCVKEVTEFLKTFKESDLNEVKDLFNDITESEAKFYM